VSGSVAAAQLRSTRVLPAIWALRFAGTVGGLRSGGGPHCERRMPGIGAPGSFGFSHTPPGNCQRTAMWSLPVPSLASASM